MDSWCFVDESWHDGPTEKVGVLAAVVCTKHAHDLLGKEMFKIRRKYFSDEHARNQQHELKGISLFSNSSFNHAKKHNFSRNLAVAREILEFAKTIDLGITVGVVYGKTTPPLLCSNPKFLAAPFKMLCDRIWVKSNNGHLCHLVFDQRTGAQEGISISVHNYLAGIAPPHRIFPHPLIGVSNIFAGLQFADIIAYILGKYSVGDKRFDWWHRILKPIRIEGKDHNGNQVYGFFRLQWTGEEGYAPRQLRTKK